MNDLDLKIWILDTVMEGDHSFKDLQDCIVNNSESVDVKRFRNAVLNLFSEELIDVFRQENDGVMLKLNVDCALHLIKEYENVVKRDQKNGAFHFIELSDKGKFHLNEVGINL